MIALEVLWLIAHTGGALYVMAEAGDMFFPNVYSHFIPQPKERSLTELEEWYEKTYPTDYITEQLLPKGASKPPVSTVGKRAGERLIDTVHWAERKLFPPSPVKVLGDAFADTIRAAQGYATVQKDGKTYHRYTDGRMVFVRDNPPDTHTSYTGPYRYPDT